MNEPIIKYKTHLTENHQLKAADELIKKLRLELGAANAYIAELEEGVASDWIKERAEYKEQLQTMEQKVEKIKAKYKQIADKYSVDMQHIRNEVVDQVLDMRIKKLTHDIEAWKTAYEQMKANRDKFVYLYQLKNGEIKDPLYQPNTLPDEGTTTSSNDTGASQPDN